MAKEKLPKLKDALKELQEIVDWFDQQEEADIEIGLEKVKSGALLIKEGRKQLRRLENEFEKVKQELEEEVTEENKEVDEPDFPDEDNDEGPAEIPF